MAFGRPTEYRDDFISQIEKYLEEYKNKGEVIPTVAGVARWLGVSRSTVNLWATQEDKRNFSDMIEKVLAEQEIKVLNNGLTGEFKPQISTLILSKHGYVNKTDLTSSDGSMSQNPSTIQLVAPDDDCKD